MKTLIGLLLLMMMAVPVFAEEDAAEDKPIMLAGSLLLMGAGAGDAGVSTPSAGSFLLMNTGAYVLANDDGKIQLNE